VALREVEAHCDWCTHILVTNGDNGYHPHFLRKTMSADKDIVATDFVVGGGLCLCAYVSPVFQKEHAQRVPVALEAVR
jgi:hypothetical protein